MNCPLSRARAFGAQAVQPRATRTLRREIITATAKVQPHLSEPPHMVRSLKVATEYHESRMPATNPLTYMPDFKRLFLDCSNGLGRGEPWNQGSCSQTMSSRRARQAATVGRCPLRHVGFRDFDTINLKTGR